MTSFTTLPKSSFDYNTLPTGDYMPGCKVLQLTCKPPWGYLWNGCTKQQCSWSSQDSFQCSWRMATCSLCCCNLHPELVSWHWDQRVFLSFSSILFGFRRINYEFLSFCESPELFYQKLIGGWASQPLLYDTILVQKSSVSCFKKRDREYRAILCISFIFLSKCFS